MSNVFVPIIQKQPEDLFATNGNPVTVQLRKIENKLLAIPIVFILLRMWGSLQFLVSIVVFNVPGAVDSDGCVSLATYVVYYILAILQVSHCIYLTACHKERPLSRRCMCYTHETFGDALMRHLAKGEIVLATFTETVKGCLLGFQSYCDRACILSVR